MATAPTEANTAGTKVVASDAGLGAGASCAATFCTAINATAIATKKIFIFNASISSTLWESDKYWFSFFLKRETVYTLRGERASEVWLLIYKDVFTGSVARRDRWPTATQRERGVSSTHCFLFSKIFKRKRACPGCPLGLTGCTIGAIQLSPTV